MSSVLQNLEIPEMSSIAKAVIVVTALLNFVDSQRIQAQPITSRESVEQQESMLFSQSGDGGMLFVDGDYVAGPYQVTATADAVFVNGIRLDGLGVRPVAGPKPPSDSTRQRDERRRSPRREAQMLSAELHDGCRIMLYFPETSLIGVDPGDAEYAFYESMIQDPSVRQLPADFLSSIDDPSTRQRLQRWLSEFQPSPSVNAAIQARKDHIDTVEAESNRITAALLRMDTLAYPLTIIAMMLGVIALGHMLKWTAQSIILNQGGTISAESIRGAEIALLLMAGMSIVDLVWTILAGQAGAMREVNPLAAGLIDSPMSLAVFKITATSLGFALLYVLRTQRRGQEVTWWMCLVCVLVTFRWVMFDSMNA